jgi:hypothetical protein
LAGSLIHNGCHIVPGNSRVSVVRDSIGQPAVQWPSSSSTANGESEAQHDEELQEQEMAAAIPRRIAKKTKIDAHANLSESSHGSAGPKPAKRRKFAPDRRKEVGNMRKLGACIRCKILRKTCSEGDPCVTCLAISSPRAWKELPCLRAKVVDLYQGYTLGLFQAVSFRDVNVAIPKNRLSPGAGQIVVSYPQDAQGFVLYASEGSMMRTDIDPSLSGGYTAKVFILDVGSNDLLTTFEKYVGKVKARLVEQETSPVIKSALLQALTLSQKPEEALLDKVVELWVATRMLSDPNLKWKISGPQKFKEGIPEFDHDKVRGRSTINEQIDPHSYALVISQLHSGVERLAIDLSKHVMHKFEQRIKRPVSTGQFETFLIAVLLINCVERHSWIFHNWTDQSKAAQWPLQQAPEDIIAQAEQFTGVVSFITKIRNLPPNVEENAGGVLKVDHSKDDRFADWYEEIAVSGNFLKQRQAAVYDSRDFRSLDMKYSAALLLGREEA